MRETTNNTRPAWTSGNPGNWQKTLEQYVASLSRRGHTIEEINRAYRLIGAHLLIGEEQLTPEEYYVALRSVYRECLISEHDLMSIRYMFVSMVSMHLA